MFRGITNHPSLQTVLSPVSTHAPVSTYGKENSPEWNYFKQQVDDYRAGRSAYRKKRTTKGSPISKLSDKDYKKESDKYYQGLLTQMNASRPAGIGEFAVSSRRGSTGGPSLINYNPSKTRAYTFSRQGRMQELGQTELSEFADIEKETRTNQVSEAVERLKQQDNITGALLRSGVFSLADDVANDPILQLTNSAFANQGGLSGLFGKGLESGALSQIVQPIGSEGFNDTLQSAIGPEFPGAIR